MGKTLKDLMAELEKKARERMTSTRPDRSSTIYEDSSTTVSESDATVYEGSITVPENEMVSEKLVRESSSGAYEKGQTILDTYTVESSPIHGGMGSVWRVHHNGWNVDLAMKRPQAKLFQSEKQKENFIGECEAWINLGLHPNIVSCYYVREIDGVPTIFSEWMENGSLENHIQKGTLYTGSEQEQQERLLDIAIQFARGLHYAHEQGLIHQDVKPDNVLLSKEWDAKVADFGLARARAQLTVLEGANTILDAGATVMAPSGGYTPAYCSMEQMDGKPLTRRIDIYSWAVSVMEMYLGERLWENGVVAGYACESYFPDCRVKMPEKLKTLLKKCMAPDPEDRPRDFGAVETELLDICRESIGKSYSRPATKAAADSAESLNNRALSFLDLGKRTEARELWRKALEQNSACPEAVFNYTVNEWLEGRTDDLAALNAVSALPDYEARVRLGRKLAVLRGRPAEDGEAVFSVLTAVQPENVISQRVLFDSPWGEMCRTFEKSGVICLIGIKEDIHGRDRKGNQHVANVGPDGSIWISEKLDASFSGSVKPCGDESGFFGRSGSGVVFYSVMDGGSWQVLLDENINSVCSGMTGNEYYMGLDNAIWFCTVEPASRTLIYKGEYPCLYLNLSCDGRRLAWSEGPDTGKALRVLNTENGAVLWERHMGKHPEAMEFSSDGLLYAAYDRHFMAFDATGASVMDCPIDSDTHSIAFSSDGELAVTGHDKGLARLWNLKRRICACSLKAGYSSVYPFFTADSDGNSAIGVYTSYQDKKTRAFDKRLLLVPCPVLRTEDAFELSSFRDTGRQLRIDEQFKMSILRAEAFLEAGKVSDAVQALESARSLEGKRFAPDCIRIYRAIAVRQEPRRLESLRLLNSFDKMTSFSLSEDGAFLMNQDLYHADVWSVENGKQVIAFEGKKPESGAFIGERAICVYRSGRGGKQDILMDVMSLPERKCVHTICLVKNALASDSSSALYVSAGGSQFLVSCPGFWKTKTLAIDSRSYHTEKVGIVANWSDQPLCLPDGRIIDRNGIHLSKGKSVPFGTPASVGSRLKLPVNPFCDAKRGICGLFAGNALGGSFGLEAEVLAFQNTLLFYSLSDGSFLKSVKLEDGSYTIQNGTWLARAEETGILLYRAADFLEQAAPQPVRFAVSGAKNCTFSADMLRIAVRTDVGVNVYELDWKLDM